MPSAQRFSRDSPRCPFLLRRNGYSAQGGLRSPVRSSARATRLGWPAGRMRWKRSPTTRKTGINAENPKTQGSPRRNAVAANRRERLGIDGNRSYNTDTCRRAVFPGKKERGADTQDRKFVETLPRGKGGCPGSARREFRSPARRIRGGHGSFGLWKVFLALCHRWTGASIPRESPRGRQRFDVLE